MVKKLYFSYLFLLLSIILFSCTRMEEGYGPLTKDRKKELENILIQDTITNKKVKSFNGPIKEWLNHFINLVRLDLGAEKVGTAIMKGTKINVESPEKLETLITPPAWGGTIYNTIYIINNLETLEFLSTIFHELGHSAENAGYSEYTSTYSVVYLSIKAYQFFRNFGSFLITRIHHWDTLENLSISSTLVNLYTKGTLAIPYVILQQKGNLEQAWNFNICSRHFLLDANIEAKIDNMSGSVEEKHFNLWEELLNSKEFKYYLLKHFSTAETEELIAYLKILNWEEHNDDISTLNKMRINFLDNTSFTNELFRAHVRVN